MGDESIAPTLEGNPHVCPLCPRKAKGLGLGGQQRVLGGRPSAMPPKSGGPGPPPMPTAGVGKG